MMSCVVEPRKSEAKCPTNIWRDLKWYLSDNGQPVKLYLSEKGVFFQSATQVARKKKLDYSYWESEYPY